MVWYLIDVLDSRNISFGIVVQIRSSFVDGNNDSCRGLA